MSMLKQELEFLLDSDIESLQSGNKISLEVGVKDLPLLYNFYHDPLVTESKLVYSPLIKIL